ncbi:MAG: hypothetical protein DI536_25975 [Archangium gephyra]|uniref:Uncharacterized protein n=1 Tax=Archangium gephyra TaxID=48 RepID=A0A2W5UXE5_9BACT|nr:MAG: hypothetical protein DI536_25975 [Archangium gephyra]
MFSNDSIRSMAREVIQNSIDARAPSEQAIHVTFTLLHIPTASVPGIAQLAEHIERCRRYTAESFRDDEAKYEENGRLTFEWATKILKGPTIPVLRVRDEQTTGLEGDDNTPNSAWDRLVRQQGSPGMHGDGGGSYGIGQLAPFALSRLRTVFYGTRTASGFGFIGKSIWRSVPSDGDWLQNIGFYGNDAKLGVERLTDPNEIPEALRRDTIGTDLFLLGFDPRLAVDDAKPIPWHQLVLDAVLKNFFAAIALGRLNVTIDVSAGNKLMLNASTLEREFDARIAAAQAENTKNTKGSKKEIQDNLLWPRQYVRALRETDPNLRFETESPRLGKMQLFVTRDDDGSCKVAHMRAPLLLVHERTLNVLSKYAAVFICEDPKGNGLLRKFEGPEHDSWTKKVPGRDVVVAEVNKFIRDKLESLLSSTAQEEQDVEGLSDYLPEDAPASPSAVKGAIKVTQRIADAESGKREPKPGKKAVRTHRQIPPVRAAPVDANDLGSDPGDGVDGTSGKENDQSDGTRGNGNEQGDGRGNRGDDGSTRPRIRPGDVRFRSWFVNPDEGTRVVVTSSRTGNATLRLRAVGEDTAYDLENLALEDIATGERFDAADSVLSSVPFTRNQTRNFRLIVTPNRRMGLSLEVVDGT